MTTEKRSCNNCNAPRKDAIAILFRCAGCKVTYDERFATKWQPIKGGASLGQKHGGKRVPNKFTPGRLKMQHPHEGERGWEIAFEPGLQQVCQNVTEANARRLVACWNASEGIDTEDLEAGSVNIIDKLHDDAARLVLQQRNELLKALKECVEDSEQAVGEYVEKYGETHRPRRLQAMRDTVTKARAAIAKAEGGAT